MTSAKGLASPSCSHIVGCSPRPGKHTSKLLKHSVRDSEPRRSEEPLVPEDEALIHSTEALANPPLLSTKASEEQLGSLFPVPYAVPRAQRGPLCVRLHSGAQPPPQSTALPGWSSPPNHDPRPPPGGRDHPHTPASSALNIPCWAAAENTQQTHIKNAL